MELQDIIRGRRSIRSYEDTPIDSQVLVELVEAGVWAPTGGNLQAWRFVIVTDKPVMKKVKMVSPGLLGDPPAAIAICQDMDEVETRGGKLGMEIIQMDTAMCAQNIMLSAYERGLGTCAVASFHRNGVHKILGLPERIVPQLLVSVGYAKKVPPPPPRKLEGLYFFEGYNG